MKNAIYLVTAFCVIYVIADGLSEKVPPSKQLPERTTDHPVEITAVSSPVLDTELLRSQLSSLEQQVESLQRDNKSLTRTNASLKRLLKTTLQRASSSSKPVDNRNQHSGWIYQKDYWQKIDEQMDTLSEEDWVSLDEMGDFWE